MKTIFTFRKQLIVILILLIQTMVSAQNKHMIEVTNNVFTPSQLTINKGDTVEWINKQGFHNVNGNTSANPENPESFGNSTGFGWTYSHVFTLEGKYKYHCDPHKSLGMLGEIEVKEDTDDGKYNLTINFSGMNPHVGQTLWISMTDKDSGIEIERKSEDINASFSIEISGIESGHSYVLNFFADHNGNETYDVPPIDHAWQIEINNVAGDTEVDFTHNTNFTDIMWKHKLDVHFSNMNPHVGQMLTLYVFNTSSNNIIDTVVLDQIPEAEFTISSTSLDKGSSYTINLFADHNRNGVYDAPPADHAWQLILENIQGDTAVSFVHNTNFTDIFNSTSISTLEETGINFYPNPVKDKLYINVPETELQSMVLTIFDVTGKALSKQAKISGKRLEVDLNNYVPGLYIVRLQSPEIIGSFKIFKE